MTKYDERIDPYASLNNSMDATHMTEEAKNKLSGVLSSMFNDSSKANSNEQKPQ
jgi:hypothetical protein